MPDSSFHFGHLVSEFAHAAKPGPPILPPGQNVSSFVHAFHFASEFIPPDPIHPGDPFGTTGPPILPQGLVVSEFVHAEGIGPPILPPGDDVSSFVHEHHGGFGRFSVDAMGWML